MMGTLLHDLRYALRGLVRQPVFAATALLTLMLGTGGTTTIRAAAPDNGAGNNASTIWAVKIG